MEYQKINMGSYNLHIINNSNFKTISVDINFRRLIKEEEIASRNLLKSVLIDSSYDYPSERSLVKALEDLYDIKIYSTSSRLGNYNNISFRMSFLNEKYTKEGLNEESINFLFSLIFKPNVQDKAFNKESVLRNKIKLENDLLALKDNKTKYSIIKLLSLYKDEVYSYNPYGDIEYLKKITPQSLYQDYLSMLNNDYVDVFVVGEVSPDQIKKLFKEKFQVKTFKKEASSLILKDHTPRKRIRIVHEKDDVNQTKIAVCALINNLTDYERRYSLKVFNEMFGGSSNSILFDTVREKNSLCYYINSDAKSYDNLLVIYSGVDNDNVSLALKLIKKCLKNITLGNFKEELLEDAKETLIAGVESLEDSQRGIISTYYAKVLVGSDDSEIKKENFKKVTKEDVMKVASKVKLDTVLLLEGGEDDEED